MIGYIGYTLGTRIGIALQCLGRTPGMFFGLGEGKGSEAIFQKCGVFIKKGAGESRPVARSRILPMFQHTKAVQVATVIVAHLLSQCERYS